MHCVYVLRHEQTGEWYFGYTQGLDRRMAEHRRHASWRLVYYEAYVSEQAARSRERNLKHYGQARTYLKKRLGESSPGQIRAGFNSHSNLRSLSFRKLRAH
jgi:predicted GIY-YIG superfamily endonuclease